jgi:hypothetical protein
MQIKPYCQSENTSRILIFSQRKLQSDLFRCSDYEFEDIIRFLDSADIIAPEPDYNVRRAKYLKFLLSGTLKKFSTVTHIKPIISESFVENEYELFYVHCMFAKDLLALNSIKNWRKKCKKAVCYIAELWTKDLDKLKEPIKVLKQFDYILLSCGSTVDEVKDVVQRPCYYFPPGVDAIKFCPFPAEPQRCIDVLSMGRRSPLTHKSLLDLAEQKKIFYVYDTAYFNGAIDFTEHRSMLANLIKRSRFFLVYPAKITNFNERGGQEVLGYRYFEGAAGGAVLLGDVPDCVYADGCFEWPNALIHLPYGDSDVAEVIAALDAQPNRIDEIRINNVVTSLLRHDWAHRWKEILDITGLSPGPALERREKRLKELAEAVRYHSSLNLAISSN